jgi:threonine dehydrogenase-like Zn-dependent dehydrogenase
MMYSSLHPDGPLKITGGQIHSKLLRLIGTVNGSNEDVFRATQMISEGIITVKPLISETYPFEKIKDALESASKGDKFRVVLTF